MEMAHTGLILCQWKYFLRIIVFPMSIKYMYLKSKLTSIWDLENNNCIILELIWNNSDTFRVSIENNPTCFFSKFISNNSVHTTQGIFFVKVRVKQYWHFQRVTTKQYYTHFSGSCYKTYFQGVTIKRYYALYIFSKLISNNIDTSRVTTKQYCEIILL